MKIEIEIPVEQIREAAQKLVGEYIARMIGDFDCREYIKAQIRAQWRGAADDAIRAMLANSSAIEAVVRDEIMKKTKAQLAKLMKDKK